MISPTYGKVTIDRVLELINKFYIKNKDFQKPFNIIVGTDSQNFSDTKVVVVIAAQCEGHGGIYFYDIERVNKIKDVRKKLNYETQKSLSYADKIISLMEDNTDYQELYLNSNFSIHIDAGQSEHGKTKELIPGIVGWIHSCGYECSIKPESFVANSIADKISK